MRKVNTLLDNAIHSIKNNVDYGLPEIDEQTAHVVNYIFKRLRGCISAFKYHADCKTSFDSIRAEYTYSLMKHKIKNIEFINLAIESIKDDGLNFLPSPGEFIERCYPEPKYIGAPSLEDAYTEACYYSHPVSGPKQWSHECVKHAWASVGPWELQQQSKSITLPLFKKFYKEAINLFVNGELKPLLEDNSEREQKEKEEFLKRQKVSEKFKTVSGRDLTMDKIKSMIG